MPSVTLQMVLDLLILGATTGTACFQIGIYRKSRAASLRVDKLESELAELQERLTRFEFAASSQLDTILLRQQHVAQSVFERVYQVPLSRFDEEDDAATALIERPVEKLDDGPPPSERPTAFERISREEDV